MKAQCPKCEAVYRIDDSKIPVRGAQIRCPKCQTRFVITKECNASQDNTHRDQMVCPMCGYERRSEDTECSQCGLVYRKYEAQIAKKLAENTGREDRESNNSNISDPTSKAQPDEREILKQILHKGEVVESTGKCVDLVPFRKVVGEGYEQTNVHLALTNLSLIIFSESLEKTYYERYTLDEIEKIDGLNELWVYHFRIVSKRGKKRKLSFKGESKRILKDVIMPKVENFIQGKISQQERDEFESIKSSLDKAEAGNRKVGFGKIIGQSQVLSGKVRSIIEENITSNEQVLFCLLGNFNQAIIAFPTSLLVIKPGFMAGATLGARVTSFLHRDITSIEVNTGAVNGVIEICTPSYQGTKQKDWWSMSRDRDPAKLSNCLPFSKVDLKKFQPYLHKLKGMIEDAKDIRRTSNESGETDITSQLERLAQLHESAALTIEEFEAAKRRILEAV